MQQCCQNNVSVKQTKGGSVLLRVPDGATGVEEASLTLASTFILAGDPPHRALLWRTPFFHLSSSLHQTRAVTPSSSNSWMALNQPLNQLYNVKAYTSLTKRSCSFRLVYTKMFIFVFYVLLTIFEIKIHFNDFIDNLYLT